MYIVRRATTKLNHNKVAAVIIFVLVLLTTFGILNPTLAQVTENQKEKAEILLNILNENNMSIVLALTKLDEQNVSSSDAQSAYSEGLSHAREAAQFMLLEKFGEACDEAVKAMRKYKETLQLLEAALPIEPTEIETTTERVISLRANLARVINYIKKIENLTAKASKTGYNTLKIEEYLGEVNQHIENITNKLHDLNLEGANAELGIVKSLLDELAEDFKRLTNFVTELRTERYLQEAEIRVSAAKINITSSVTLTPEAKEDAITALNNSETSLANARDMIEDSNVDDAIKELEEAKKWEERSNIVSSAAAVTSSASATNESLSNIEAIDSNEMVQP